MFEKALYKVCKRSVMDAAGRPSYNPLVLFKMMLLPPWYHLSAMGVEDMVNENLAAHAFCGLRVADPVPDHSTLIRFRSELSEKRAMNRLLTKLEAQLRHRGVGIQSGGILDTAINPYGSYAPRQVDLYLIGPPRHNAHQAGPPQRR